MMSRSDVTSKPNQPVHMETFFGDDDDDGDDVCSDLSEGEGEGNLTDKEVEMFQEEDPFFLLTRFQSCMYATIIEDALLSLRILGECNNHIRVMRFYNDIEMHMRRRYDVKDPAVKPDELELIDPKWLGCDQYKLYKIERDREQVADVLKSIYKGLCLACSLRPLWHYCQEVERHEERVEKLKNDTDQNKILARTLRKQTRQHRIHHMAAEYDADAVFDDLQKQIQDSETMAAIKLRYTGNWQHARTEQHEEEINLKHGALSNSIEHYKRRSEQESVVHGEIETLININIDETLQKINDIMLKYDRDMERIDLSIQITMSNLNKILTENEQLENTIKTRDAEMKAWTKFKKDRETAMNYQNKMTNAAVTVQAWWRGILVRLKLGPFREDKRGKRGKAKKAKEKIVS